MILTNWALKLGFFGEEVEKFMTFDIIATG